MADRAHRLEPSREDQEAWLSALGHFVQDHLAGLETAPAAGPTGAAGEAIAAEVSRPVGEEPLPGGLPEIIRLLDRAASASLTAPGPGYLAYIPGGGIYAAALADFVSDALNRYTGMTAPAPAFGRLEQDVLAWLCAAFGYGPESRGLLTAGGSLANLSAVIAARHARFGDSGRYDGALVYTSSQAHHSVAKAVRMAGIPAANLRVLPTDSAYRLLPEELAGAVARDRREGKTPFLAIASAGTTNTGAIDPLGPLADICSRENLWLHVDAAYGGAFVLCDEGRRRLAGIERADSITFDPHKGMFLPYGTGCLLVRDGARLRDAHHLAAEYLQDFGTGDGVTSRSAVTWSPAELGPELSRDFRGLRLWLPLMLHGAGAFRDALAEKLELAREFARDLARLGTVEVVAEPQLSVVPFRLARLPQEGLEAWNARNAAFLTAINNRGRVHLSSTLLPAEDGRAFTLRACVLSFRTHSRHMQRALEDVAAAARAV